MLARTLGPKYSNYPAFIQPKLNGVRALYQRGFFQSRDEKIWAHEKLIHLTDELATLPFLGQTMLDNELYVHGWRLQRINGAVAVNSATPREDTHLVECHVFDAIDERGFKCKFSERWLDLAILIASANLSHIKVVPTALVHSRAELDQWFRRWTSEGYEGVMLRPDGPYEVGETPHGTQRRSEYLWKYKHWEDAEFLCVGVTQGEGKADIGIGALILTTAPGEKDWDNNDILLYGQQFGKLFNCGTGFTDEDRIELARNPPIGRLIRVRVVEYTADGIPYPCRFEAVM